MFREAFRSTPRGERKRVTGCVVSLGEGQAALRLSAVATRTHRPAAQKQTHTHVAPATRTNKTHTVAPTHPHTHPPTHTHTPTNTNTNTLFPPSPLPSSRPLPPPPRSLPNHTPLHPPLPNPPPPEPSSHPFTRQQLLGLGSAQKWYATYNSKPNRCWDRTAENMQNFQRSGHLKFRCTSALERGQLRSKEGGKTTIHFTASDDNVQFFPKKKVISVNQCSFFRSSSGFDSRITR